VVTEDRAGADHGRPRLDELPVAEVISRLLDAEARVVPAVRGAAEQLTAAATELAESIVSGGRLVFVGAGTSGRLAAAEAAELPGTFGIAAGRCHAVIAGADSELPDDGAEDDAVEGEAAVNVLDLDRGDIVIAVAASGSTPFTLAAARAAKATGARVIGIVTTPGSPLADVADVAVEVVPGDEVLRGSTRLTAGTAQKVALNALTTAAMAAAGRVHGDLMIDVVPANAKLRDRLAGIVAEIAGCTAAEAAAAVAACQGDGRAAVLHLVRGMEPADAIDRAASHRSLRAALDA
jgi:N-acetylmuramic acid 6-phosphate etherase